MIRDGKPWLIGSEDDSSPVGSMVTTNIRMEGLALLNAIKDADGKDCTIYSDSEFWINVLTKWAPSWEANGWVKKGGIKNLDIVKSLFTEYSKSNPKLVWVRGHDGTELNELADRWANKAREIRVRGVQRVVE